MSHSQSQISNSHPFFHLLQPYDFGFLKIKNRLIMGSMHSGLEDSWDGYQKLAHYLEARARGGAGLIITGGIAPNFAGRGSPFGSQLSNFWQVPKHRRVTEAVHRHESKIVMQILHTGRYAYHPLSVSASAIQSPITPFKPRALSERGIQKTIKDFAHCARLAQKAGYDGVEIMGSEGYLIHQFFSERTNQRKDRWGGSLENRARLALEIIQAIKKATGPNFLIIFRLSLVDLVEKGFTWDETLTVARWLESSGVHAINSGIGWHEAKIPTIATSVPRGSFIFATEKLKKELTIPVIAVNRINTPELAENILKQHQADFVSLARPWLADADFGTKTEAQRSDEINTCIACNQACLDHIFKGQRASCLVNPQACFESELTLSSTSTTKKVIVVGAGPAGLSAALYCAQAGFQVTCYEKGSEIGGQFNLARKIPGKEEFNETLRYYQKQFKKYSIQLILNHEVTLSEILKEQPDAVIVATGVKPRLPKIPGIQHPSVIAYDDLIKNFDHHLSKFKAHESIAIIGAGGIGFDVATLLIEKTKTISDYQHYWGIDTSLQQPGALTTPERHLPQQKITLFQRKESKFGSTLGKTTGWIHRQVLKNAQVSFIPGVEYTHIDDNGLHYQTTSKTNQKTSHCYPAQHIILCAGQESVTDLTVSLKDHSIPCITIGGAKLASEVDAKRAIREGLESAIQLKKQL